MEKLTITEWSKKSINLLRDKNGVYCLRNGKGEYLYIGASTKLHNRLRRFYGGGFLSLEKRGIKFTVDVYMFDDASKMAKVEYDLINQHRPTQNVYLIETLLDKHDRKKMLFC